MREPGRAGRGPRWGIDLFIEEGAYTTLAAAVTILVVLTLLFSSVTATWSMSRAGDVQVSADAAALAGANVVSSYTTAATVMDACILSLGLAGTLVTGAGAVSLLIPGAGTAGAEMVQQGLRIIEKRNEFSKKVSSGLKKVESALPYLVAANALRICSRQAFGDLTYTGTAVAVPWRSASNFAASEKGVDASGLEEATSDLEEASQELQRANEETARAKEAAWLADCGRPGSNMQERAGRLSGLPAAENPDYESSIGWSPRVALDRARSYYRWRAANEEPLNDSVEERANAAARRASYRFAYEELRDAAVTETSERVSSDVPLLPKNTAEVRSTPLFTDAMWPSSIEDVGVVLHYGDDCPGITGDAGPMLSLADIERGGAYECPVCQFTITDMGRVPAASTSIDNGFEYHLREFTVALDDYVACRNREIELERKTREEGEATGAAFEEVIEAIGGERPKVAPPGRYGCLALVTSGAATSPDSLDTDFSAQVELGERGAISAAVLAPDEATLENNVLASFFSSLKENAAAGGVAGVLDVVMDLWGALLVGYGAAGDGLSSIFDGLLGPDTVLGPIGSVLRGALTSAIEGLGLEPVDMRLKKPVLTDTSNVIERSDISALSDMQGMLRRIPLGVTDPADLLEAVTYLSVDKVTSYEFTLAELDLPGGGTLPITIRLQDVMGAQGG